MQVKKVWFLIFADLSCRQGILDEWKLCGNFKAIYLLLFQFLFKV